MNQNGKCEGPGGRDRRGALCTGFIMHNDSNGHLRGTYIMKLDYTFNIGPLIYIYINLY